MRKTKKLLSVLLTLCMIASMIVIGTAPASALSNSSGDQWVYPVWRTSSNITAAENLASGTSGTYYYDPSTGDYGIGSSFPLSWSASAVEVNTDAIDAFFKAYVVINGSYYSMTGTFVVGSAYATQTLNQDSQLYCPNNCYGTVTNSGTYYITVPPQGSTVTVNFACYTRMWHANGANLESSTSVTLNFTTNCSHSQGYIETVTPNTCTSGGYTTYVCRTCGYTYTGANTPALGHNYNGAYHNVSAGTHNQQCERFSQCGTYGVGTTQNATVSCSGGVATCTAQPVCDYCHTSYGSTLGHNWDYANASFNWNGYECASATVPCTRGDDSTTVSTTVTNEITTQPTCETSGERTYTASFTANGRTYISQKMEPVKALGHNYNGTYHNVVAGSHNRACERFAACGTYGIGTTQNATENCSGGTATCTAKAVCASCNTAYGNTLGHNWDYANATFNWNGYACPNVTVKCTRDDGHSMQLSTEVTNEVTKQPTCVAPGTRTYTAGFTMGGQTYTSQKTETLSATGVHNYSAATVKPEALKSEATCMVPATYYYSCTMCGAVENNDENTFTNGGIDNTNHKNTRNTDAVTANCVTEGFTAGTYCDDCRQYVSGHVSQGYDFTENGHSYGAWESNGDNTHTKTCIRCAAETANHTVTANCSGGTATCLVKATCEGCGAVYGEFGAHALAEEAAVPPTCATTGHVAYWHCSVCGKDFTDETASEVISVFQNAHSYGELIAEVPAKCEEAGTVAHYHCSVCGTDFDTDKNVITDLVIPASGHTYGDLIAEVPAKCEEAGTVAHYHCSACGKDFDADKNVITDLVIPASGHTYGDLIAEVPAKCEEAGTVAHYHCDACGKDFDADKNVITDLVIPASGHTYGDLIAEVPAKCEESGTVAHYHCAACGKDFDVDKNVITDLVIPASGHTYGDLIAEVPAKCEESGTVAHYHCDACNKDFDADKNVITDLVIPASGHTSGSPVKENETPATCTEAGSYELVTYCAVCETELSRESFTIPAGHTAGDPVIENEIAPTCTEDGSHEVAVYCTECGEEISRTTVTDPAKGHVWGEWEIVTPATEEEDGLAKHVCTVCGEEETKPLSALGEEVTKTIRFINIAKMCYELDLGDGETYTIYNSSVVQWISKVPLKFTVYTYSGYQFEDIVIRANGVVIEPDEGGYYSLPQTAETVIVSAEGAVKDDTAPGGKLSFWELLIRFFRSIVAFFSSMYGKNN